MRSKRIAFISCKHKLRTKTKYLMSSYEKLEKNDYFSSL